MSSTVQPTSANARNQTAIGMRHSGLRENNAPTIGLATIAPMTSSPSVDDAALGDMPCACTRYG